MKYSRIRATKPPRVITLPEGYFKETGNPDTGFPGTRVGIRRLSIAELQYCYEEAKNYQIEGISSYHQSVMINVVAQALVFPDDVSKRYLKAGDLEARSLFTPSGIEYLYDIVLQLHLSVSPIYEEISDDNVKLLIRLLTTKKIPAKLRRILSYVLDELSNCL